MVCKVKKDVLSYGEAKQLEAKLTEHLQRDVLLVGPNVDFFRLEVLTDKEVASLFPKGVTEHAPAPEEAKADTGAAGSGDEAVPSGNAQEAVGPGELASVAPPQEEGEARADGSGPGK
jgi:hypothetical protein